MVDISFLVETGSPTVVVFLRQRPIATIARLTVGQFKQALDREKPVLDIPPECDKIRMQHYCPIHPQAIEAIVPLLDGRDDNE
jgi:hypothetical protein